MPHSGGVVVVAGDSLVEHVVAVSDAMEAQDADLPTVGSRVVVDRHEKRGWVSLLQARLTAAFPDLQFSIHNVGRGGDTSRLLLERFPTDVLALRPAWCLLAVGVVDIRRTFQPERVTEAVRLDEYRSNLRAMIQELRAAAAQVVLLEPTGHARPPVGAPASVTVTQVNALTAAYVAAMNALAKECAVGRVELFQQLLRFEARLQDRTPPETMYADDIHLNPTGDMMYADLVFGFLSATWTEAGHEGPLRGT
jgi:lysophospholipase L1-like esterase